MANPVVLYDAAGLIISTVAALVVARKSAKAYNLTGRTYLLNFSAGFLCLAGSWALTIVTVIALYGPPPFGIQVIPAMLYSPNMLPRLILELGAFMLIASSYFSRDRAGSVLLLALIGVAAVLGVISSAVLEPLAGQTTTGIIRLFDTALIFYTLIQVSRSYTTKVVPGSFYVSWGFGMLTLSQYTWLIWSYSGTLLVSEVAATLRVIGILILVYSLRK